MDAALLARSQFGLTIGFHILFPTLTIGLAWFLVFFEAGWHRRQQAHYLELYRFWVKIFALTFGVGVVSGLVLSYEIGTNFSRFSQISGPVLGPLMSLEVLTAFFVEAGFLGVMLFGWNKVGPHLHFAATLLVAIGTTNSAFWIISANSFMHTPQGVEWVGGHLEPVDWLAIIFNPSFPYRLAHMVLAALLTGSLVVAGVSAWYLRQARHRVFAELGVKAGVIALAILAPLQIAAGDQHGLEVARYQPAKVAAMEALWQTRHGVPLVLFALPDQAAQENRYELAIPKLSSLILTHSLDGEVKGMNVVPRADQPPVLPVFFGFRIMVGLGFWFLLLGSVSLLLLWRGRLFTTRPVLGLLALSAPLGFIATEAGWIVAETGRQPWVIYGLLRTADAVSPVPAAAVATTLIAFAAIYSLVLVTYLHFLLKLIRRGPAPPEPRHPEAMRGARIAEVVQPTGEI